MSLSKKLRFEVFKRDSFTCMYCGAKAPGAILEVNHTKPRCKKGKDDMSNLITSCFDCNRGKGKRELSDEYQSGIILDQIKKTTLKDKNWTQWENDVIELIDLLEEE